MFRGKIKIIASLLGIACAGLIIIGVYYYVKETAFLNECKLIKCKIVQIDEPYKGKATLYLKDISGTYRQFYYIEHYDASEDELDYELNEIYEVYYYPPDPNRSEIKSFMDNHETSMIFIIIALSFIIDIPIMLFMSNLKRKSQLQDQQYGIKDEVISET